MIIPNLSNLAYWLTNASHAVCEIDLFSEYWPPEMKRDFRQGISADWRGGWMQRTDTSGDFKALFGSEALARKVADALAPHGIAVEITPPHVGAEVECDGESLGRERVAWWTARWKMDAATLASIEAAGRASA